MSTTVELSLSPAYRSAQRALAAWVEQAGAAARRNAFAARAALAGLNPAERSRLARWLAWLCVAAGSRGDFALIARIRRLDGPLYTSVDEALDLLPATAILNSARLRFSA